MSLSLPHPLFLHLLIKVREVLFISYDVQGLEYYAGLMKKKDDLKEHRLWGERGIRANKDSTYHVK